MKCPHRYKKDCWRKRSLDKVEEICSDKCLYCGDRKKEESK